MMTFLCLSAAGIECWANQMEQNLINKLSVTDSVKVRRSNIGRQQERFNFVQTLTKTDIKDLRLMINSDI